MPRMPATKAPIRTIMVRQPEGTNHFQFRPNQPLRGPAGGVVAPEDVPIFSSSPSLWKFDEGASYCLLPSRPPPTVRDSEPSPPKLAHLRPTFSTALLTEDDSYPADLYAWNFSSRRKRY